MIRRYYEPPGRTPPAARALKDAMPSRAGDAGTQRMRQRAHFLVALLAMFSLGACVYVAPIAQGNLLKQDDVDQVEVGMTRGQVRFLLGTPMIDDPFHRDRWDYVYYLKIGRRDAGFKRWISVMFDGDRVSEIIADQTLNPDL